MEIQSATDGDMTDWYWIKGTENTADWLTSGKTPSELGPDSSWWKGPEFSYRPEDEWGVKLHIECIDATWSRANLKVSKS